jgi:hypothetical protein
MYFCWLSLLVLAACVNLLLQDMPKKSLLCFDDKRADEAASKQSEKQGTSMKYKQIRAAGGEEYRTLLLDFRRSSPAAGRGKPRM